MTAEPTATPGPDLYYSVEHQMWARLEPGGCATIGITQLGIQLSGEIYMCRAKRIGTAVAQGATVAVVELAKAIVAVKSPVSGVVIARNELAEQQPWLVHTDPFGQGWIARLELTTLASDQAALLHGAAAAAAQTEYAHQHEHEFIPATTPQSK